jgi:hypothetical protein
MHDRGGDLSHVLAHRGDGSGGGWQLAGRHGAADLTGNNCEATAEEDRANGGDSSGGSREEQTAAAIAVAR